MQAAHLHFHFHKGNWLIHHLAISHLTNMNRKFHKMGPTLHYLKQVNTSIKFVALSLLLCCALSAYHGPHHLLTPNRYLHCKALIIAFHPLFMHPPLIMAHTTYYHPTGTRIGLFSYLVDCTFHPLLFDPPIHIS